MTKTKDADESKTKGRVSVGVSVDEDGVSVVLSDCYEPARGLGRFDVLSVRVS